jgi:hypothetical protein
MNNNFPFPLLRLAIPCLLLVCAGCDEAPKAEPSVSNIDWSTIDSIYNLKHKKTDLQKDERWKEFKGQKVRWTGKVTSVGQSFGSLTLQVKMNPDTWTSDVLVDLKDSEKPRAARLNQGESVTFTGILDSWGSILPITLKSGEIVN